MLRLNRGERVQRKGEGGPHGLDSTEDVRRHDASPIFSVEIIQGYLTVDTASEVIMLSHSRMQPVYLSNSVPEREVILVWVPTGRKPTEADYANGEPWFDLDTAIVTPESPSDRTERRLGSAATRNSCFLPRMFSPHMLNSRKAVEGRLHPHNPSNRRAEVRVCSDLYATEMKLAAAGGRGPELSGRACTA